MAKYCLNNEDDKIYLTENVVFGKHRYWRPGDDSTVFYVNEHRRIRRQLIDRDGHFLIFPGIEEGHWIKWLQNPNALEPRIRFRTAYYPRGDKWILCWQVQPDGWYWADEGGFGAEHDVEVTLYTYLDREGNYTGPFRISQD